MGKQHISVLGAGCWVLSAGCSVPCYSARRLARLMPSPAGTRLGPYEIVTPLGAGGMGEVYKARDIRLDRVVALKVLPATLAADPEFRERFEREAKSISALNHPNICALYDVGRQDGTEYLVMEYLEGETLAARIERGALPTNEALSIAIDIASALDRAHRQGIVHRDLKPGNVMLIKGGARSGRPQAKLLDFGLAKINPTAALSGATTAALPPGGAPLTAQGTILGTFQYMSPEQIEGEEADARTDIFAFGAVLFEMLTGRKAFTGKSQASLLGAILKDQPPPVSQVQPLTPPALDRVVSTCLAKDREDRFHTAHDLLLQLRWVVEGGSAAGVPAPLVTHRRNRERLAWIAFGIATLLLLATLVPTWRYFHPAVDERQIQFPIPIPGTPDPGTDVSFSVSPDGRTVAMVAPTGPGRLASVWVRRFDEPDARPLDGTEGAFAPFWSPDSRHLGFFAKTRVMSIDVTGGSPAKICDISISNASGAWGPDGTILYAAFDTTSSNMGAPLYRVPASGGTPVELLRPDAAKRETGYSWPNFLPDGRHFLYLSWSDEPGKRSIRVGSLDGGPPTTLMQSELRGVYAPPGFLLVPRDGTLFAQPFDPDRRQLSGEPTRLASGVIFNRVNGGSAFSVSENGVLAYRAGGPIDVDVDLVWLNRSGQPVGKATESASYDQVRLSPDGLHAVASRLNIRSTQYELWTIDLKTGIATQVTFDRPGSNDPVWSPDSKSVAFESISTGRRQFYTQAISSQQSTPVYESAEDPKWLDDWSPVDGKFLLYHLPPPSKLYALPLSADPKPRQLTQSNGLIDSARFSPTGQWVSYNASDSNRPEVFVAPFPAFDNRQQISTQGGGLARWRGDGKELFYLTQDGQMMSVAIDVDAKAGALTFKTPSVLFQSPLSRLNLASDKYDVTRDGQKFLFVQSRPGTTSIVPPVTVVMNWLVK